jgi:CheY-like chemotaxis protein
LNILIVDDDAQLAKQLVASLTESGHEVVHAGDGKKGELEEGIGRSRGEAVQTRFTPLWMPPGTSLDWAISGGQLHDSQMMNAFLDWDILPLAIVADKAYGA